MGNSGRKDARAIRIPYSGNSFFCDGKPLEALEEICRL
jgi:hypothetical protein